MRATIKEQMNALVRRGKVPKPNENHSQTLQCKVNVDESIDESDPLYFQKQMSSAMVRRMQQV